MYPNIQPTTEHEKASFHKNPKAYIEAQLEKLRLTCPLVHSVHQSIIQNNLTDSDFNLFLAYYACVRMIDLENEKIRTLNTTPSKPLYEMS